MQPRPWEPSLQLSSQERAIIKRVRRGKLFVFLREWRHELFSPAFQQELAEGLYKASARGQPPVPPAQLAMATILQAYTGLSDDELIEASTMDARWGMALDCLGAEQPPFSKGTLVAFRQRLIETDMDRRLLERTVQLAAERGGFGARNLRAALDSSPLWGAGRVEDTYNLLGHALRKALGVMARQQGRELAAICQEADAGLLAGPSLKAALDLDWDDPAARVEALGQVLAALEAVEAYVGTAATPAVASNLQAARQVQAQDVEWTAAGEPALRRGVAKDRRISIQDPQMRHGRKSRARRVDGFKRHVLSDLDSDLVLAVGVTPANEPEASVTDSIQADLAHLGGDLGELHVDRAYLSSRLVRERPADLSIFCKAWPVRNGERFAKTAFRLDWQEQVIRCPNDVAIAFQPGGVVHFPAEVCAACPLRARCTASPRGRSVTIHPDERLLAELRERQTTPAGRAKLRQRVGVEHRLAHIGTWQGDRARYLGTRKNLFDTRRNAVVNNLHVLARRYPLPLAA